MLPTNTASPRCTRPLWVATRLCARGCSTTGQMLRLQTRCVVLCVATSLASRDLVATVQSGLTARRLAQSRRDDQRWEDVYNFLGLWQEQLQAKRAAQAASDADGSGVAVVPA